MRAEIVHARRVLWVDMQPMDHEPCLCALVQETGWRVRHGDKVEQLFPGLVPLFLPD